MEEQNLTTRVDEWCRQTGKTRADLANEIGVVPRMIYYYEERGVVRLRPGIVHKLAKALGCTAEDIYGDAKVSDG